MDSAETLKPRGGFERSDGLLWYRIDDVDGLDPFLMSIVSPSEHWMFVSSSGALTAGRRSAREALFSYETDDRLHRSGGITGPVTIIRTGSAIWRPFDPLAPPGSVRRSISKTVTGDRVTFEEREPELGLTFAYTWVATDRFGFVRRCRLSADSPTEVAIIDGLMDVLPAGVDPWTQQTASTLVDGYRRSELDPETGLALFTLEALVSDAPEAAESLLANVVWSHGLVDPAITLSDHSVRSFLGDTAIECERLVTGRKGGYFVRADVDPAPGRPTTWTIVADVSLDHRRLGELRRARTTPDLATELERASNATTAELRQIVAAADGEQVTGDLIATTHHFANVLFNCMRGGVFLDDHRIDIDDLGAFLRRRNQKVASRFAERSFSLPTDPPIGVLREWADHDPDLLRLVNEYLPLRFSRRHGDPSRPWNVFEIPAGNRIGYQGNWRDIFQNWEALGRSFPGFLESTVFKFLNASTVDGFNPCRISDDGIDWDEPGDGAWANFGYWGDHQITYLYRLLVALERSHPGRLGNLLDRSVFSYADVPYRLLPYESLVRDPKHTIEFDHERNRAIDRRLSTIGADARLVLDGDSVLHVSLCEKLLVPMLSKLSNLVAGAGIWMNTQRPEWNDANNALVGHGVSTVTAIHLIDYLEFVASLLRNSGLDVVPISTGVEAWLHGVVDAFVAHSPATGPAIDSAARRSLLDDLGSAFSSYRDAAYGRGPGDARPVSVATIEELIERALPFLHECLHARTRDDGLIDSYGLVRFTDGRAEYEPLQVMLEGQVAALACSAIDHDRATEIIDALYASDLYRADQNTFILYPDTPPPPFPAKNVVPDDLLGPAATDIVARDAGVMYRDPDGVVRFTADIHSARYLAPALARVEATTGDLPPGALDELTRIHEEVFHHTAFTGRSGTMYRYEGLGSVYWHMVSKLLHAVQSRVIVATATNHPAVADLAARYDRIRRGLGHHKTVKEQGTFPTDPHSHTPAHTGAQQPGMTGQVKEGVLLRWGELGVTICDGRFSLAPILLDRTEFLVEARPWERLGAGANLQAGTLGFTLCGVPVVYHHDAAAPWTRVVWAGGETTEGGAVLSAETSAAVMRRDGAITRIDVGVDPDAFLLG